MTGRIETPTSLLAKLGSYKALPELDLLNPYLEPVVVHVRKGNQQIVAIGPNHTRLLDTPGYKVIRNKFQTFREETGSTGILLNEGRLRTPGATEDDSILQGGEGELLAFFAKQYGLPIISPEPPSFSESIILLQQGFSPDEIFYYYQARYIPQWHRLKGEKPPVSEYLGHFARKYKKGLMYINPNLWSDFDISYENFQRIHHDIFPDIPFNPDDNDFFVDQTVRYNRSDTVIQRIAQACATERGKSLAEEVIKQWDEGKSIFISYGRPHILVLKPLLEALGTSTPSEA